MMPGLHRIAVLFVLLASPVMAGLVMITSLPDSVHAAAPLTSLNEVVLADGVEVSIGAFPGMSDEAVLDAASHGIGAIGSAFVRFGTARSIGDGVGDEPGNFEIVARQAVADGAPWAGEEISLLIRKDEGQEFLIARFKGERFELDSDTGLEALISLHLADARLIAGNHRGTAHFSTSPMPARGSYASWITGFPQLADPNRRLPDADADGDGRSNFLEYATGGDPVGSDEVSPCTVQQDGAGALWIRFAQVSGVGLVSHEIEYCSNLTSLWTLLEGTVEVDPVSPVNGSVNWLRMRVPAPLGTAGFFRLRVK